jgi:hypothetical protein
LATAGLAIFPWVLKLNGGKLYSYERASIPETAFLLAITTGAIIVFFNLIARGSRKRWSKRKWYPNPRAGPLNL